MYQPTTYTVESVTSGHPDKVCDQMSDAILDECLRQDPKSRVACETFGGHGLLVIGGEVTTYAQFDAEKIARALYQDIGYDNNLKVITHIVKQSPDIAQGVDTGGAGDQGIMYGYATDETPEFMPFAVVKVHELSRGLEKLRRSGQHDWLRPDGKTQLTVEHDKITKVLVSTQHSEDVEQAFIREQLIKYLIEPIIGGGMDPVRSSLAEVPDGTRAKGASETSNGVDIFVNPTGRFVQGGFEGDAGLTGRKIMVDTYCGLAPHGGGAFSGKDATKVDRSAAYMWRFVAKNLVANGFAKRCLVSVSYAIGMVEPLMVEALDENDKSLSDIVKKHFDFRPKAIIERLNLRAPRYQETAAYGHFGVAGRSWEEVIKIS